MTRTTERFMNFYLRRPIINDLIGALVILLLFRRFCFFCIVSDQGVGQEVASEMINIAFNASGFFLTILGLIISIKQLVPNMPAKDGTTAQERFYNSTGYGKLAKVFALATLEGAVLFLFFTLMKFAGFGRHADWITYATLAGVLLLFFLIARCVWLLYQVVLVHTHTQKKSS